MPKILPPGQVRVLPLGQVKHLALGQLIDPALRAGQIKPIYSIECTGKIPHP